MPEKPEKNEIKKTETNAPEKNEKESDWAKDQRENGYYYDDNHGYEIYDPEKDDD